MNAVNFLSMRQIIPAYNEAGRGSEIQVPGQKVFKISLDWVNGGCSRKDRKLKSKFNWVLKNKNQAVRQGTRRYDKRSIPSICDNGESRATLKRGLRRSFSTAC